MSTARVRDIEMYYEIHGSGPPLVMISGTGNDLRASAPESHPLNHHFRCVHYDQRGLGQTTVGDHAPTMADFADDAAGLLDALGWGRAKVMGVSFGGMVAQHLALRHPERIERLVLCCTSPGGDLSSYPLDELPALEEAERAQTTLRLMDTRYDGDIAAVPGLSTVIEQFVARSGATAAATREASEQGSLAQLEARRHHDLTDHLGEIGCPTLVTAGRYDGIAPPANSEFIAAAIPGAEYEVYDGGHAFLMQVPTSLERIRDFLGDP